MARSKGSVAKPSMTMRALRKPKADRPARGNGSASPHHFDWEALSLEAVNTIIAAAEARRMVLRREAETALRTEFEAKAAAFGLTLEDLVGEKGAGSLKRRAGARSKGVQAGQSRARFKGPNGETWSGRGPTPRWLKALEATGKPRSDFAV